MIPTPATELKEWVSLIKDVILGIAGLFTIWVGAYGLNKWKHEHRGKEAFDLIKKLVKESHKMSRACATLRGPVNELERRIFVANELELLTKSERWKISEKEAFEKRFEKFGEANAVYTEALLEARATLGSHIYAAFLDFGHRLTENVKAANSYLDEVLSESFVYSHSNQPELIALQERFLASIQGNSLDDLAEKTADAREAGEVALAKYLGRRTNKG